MSYAHRWVDGSPVDLPRGKVVCVGHNYAKHVRELGSEMPDEPVLFIKPATSLVEMEARPLVLPEGLGEVHHEIEMAMLVSEPIRDMDAAGARYCIGGYALALDLTLRDVQNRLKEKGLPWERAKAFDGSCPVSAFVDARGVSVRQELSLRLSVNGTQRQQGHTGEMLFPAFELLSHMSRCFTLEPGDIVLTGTPEGVGPLQSGDRLEASLGNILSASATIA